jgi:hypothetical protein
MSTCKGLGTILALIMGRKENPSFYMGWVELARLKFVSNLLKKMLICEYLGNLLLIQDE